MSEPLREPGAESEAEAFVAALNADSDSPGDGPELLKRRLRAARGACVLLRHRAVTAEANHADITAQFHAAIDKFEAERERLHEARLHYERLLAEVYQSGLWRFADRVQRLVAGCKRLVTGRKRAA